MTGEAQVPRFPQVYLILRARKPKALRAPVEELAGTRSGPHPVNEATLRLHAEDLERLADAVAERLHGRLAGSVERTLPALLTAGQLAEQFGVSAQWVREHADELGARRLGSGAKPRLRFDATEVARRLASRSVSERSHDPDPPSRLPRAKHQPPGTGSGAELLPIRAEITTRRSPK